MVDFFRTRKGKLKEKIELELDKETPNIEQILNYVDDYERVNLITIEKLKRAKIKDIRKINGALKQTINAHGPITIDLIGSASKRIYGALLNDKKSNFIKRLFKFLF